MLKHENYWAQVAVVHFQLWSISEKHGSLYWALAGLCQKCLLCVSILLCLREILRCALTIPLILLASTHWLLSSAQIPNVWHAVYFLLITMAQPLKSYLGKLSWKRKSFTFIFRQERMFLNHADKDCRNSSFPNWATFKSRLTPSGYTW